MGLSKKLVFRSLAVLARVLRAQRQLRKVPAAAKESGVTIIEPFGLGDVISHEPLVRELRAAGWGVTFCAPRPWRELLPDVTWIDSAIAWGHHTRSEKYTVREYFRPQFRVFLKTLREAANGSIGIDTRGDIRSVLLLYLAGCREVISVSKYLGTDLGIPRFVGTLVEFDPGLRRWQLNLRCLALLGLESRNGSRPALPQWERSRTGNQRRIGLLPVAPWPGKWWQPEKWAQLVTSLRYRGYHLAGLCGPAQTAAAKQQINSEIIIHECASVSDWASHFQGFDLFVTLDSGPMHLAEAMGTPVVALFGQGLLPLWAPSHPASQIVTHQDDADFRVCLPSETNTAKGQEFMRRISVDEVLRAVDRALIKSAL